LSIEQEDAQIYKINNRHEQTIKEQFHLVQTLKGHGDGIPDIAFSADGRRLASCGKGDETIILWDVATGSVLRTLVIGKPPAP